MLFFKQICLLIIVIFLAGCGTHSLRPLTEAPANFAESLNGDSLWKIKIIRFGKERFSGILALKNYKTYTQFALLDGSGIKLFEEKVSAEGSLAIASNLKMFDNHPLPNYLGKVIYNVFIEAPASSSDSVVFYNLCWRQDEKQWVKTAKFGPLPLWKAKYKLLADSDGLTETNEIKIEHHSTWLGTTVYLQRIE